MPTFWLGIVELWEDMIEAEPIPPGAAPMEADVHGKLLTSHQRVACGSPAVPG
jgi:hypothetical protein